MSTFVPELAHRVPLWSRTGIQETAWIPGGITNRNLRVTAGGKAFVVRIAGDNSKLLGINRRHELAAHKEAARIGIAPEVVFFIEPEEYLVTRFLHAQPIPLPAMRSEENLRRVAECLRRIHEMGTIPGSFSPFRTVELYAATCRDRGVPIPDDFDVLSRSAASAERVLADLPFVPRPCHNDLLNENFLDDGAIRILDWEYAAMGDPFFDLGNFSANHDLQDVEESSLLRYYFGSTSSAREARLKLMRAMSLFREAMWGMVQLSLSKLEFDFAAYARKNFVQAVQTVRDPRWNQWLESAGADD
jgi:thiamine kinase-like enzyme